MGDQADNSAGCPFCRSEREMLIESGHSFAFPDGFPIAEGHSLVIPRRHDSSLFDLTEEEQMDLWRLVTNVRNRLTELHRPDGFNVGLNDGRAAGQTVMHAHVHVIPRRHGDVADPRGGVRWVVPDKAAYWGNQR